MHSVAFYCRSSIRGKLKFYTSTFQNASALSPSDTLPLIQALSPLGDYVPDSVRNLPPVHHGSNVFLDLFLVVMSVVLKLHVVLLRALCRRSDDVAPLSTEVKRSVRIFPGIISRVISADENSYVVAVACAVRLFARCDYVRPILLVSDGASAVVYDHNCCVSVGSSSSACSVSNHLTVF